MSAKQLIIVGLFYLFIFTFGYWLAHSGKPYNGFIMTIHKLVSVVAVVFLVIAISRINKAAALNAVELTAVVFTGLFFLCTIVTGALLSIDKPMPVVIMRLHQVIPYLTVLSTALTLYLLLSRK